MQSNGPILLAYDGSDDARFAIDEAARIVAGAAAIVLYVRQPLESVARDAGTTRPALSRRHAARAGG